MFTRKEGPRLTIELVPTTCQFSNLRSNLSSGDWDRLRKEAYKESSYRCVVCFGRGDKHPVEGHEVWHYDEQRYIQKLVDIVALCPACHSVKHMGLATLQGRGGAARKHLAKVNGWDAITVAEYEADCYEEYKRRSMFHWTLDLSWLKDRGIRIPRVLDRPDWGSSPLPKKGLT